MLYPGLPLKLTTENPLYKGSLDSKVLEVNDNDLVITAPLQDGRLTLLPVGTILQVRPAGSAEDLGFQSEILSRTFQPQRTLTITLPHAISRSGRNQTESAPAQEEKNPPARVIAVTSGKGGVGKTTTSINLSIELSRRGYRVALIDVDLGTANVEFLLNLNSPYNIAHLLNGEKKLEEILIKGPQDVSILPGASGLEKLANLNQWQFTRLVNSFNQLDQMCDVVILDTGAGISANVTNFLMAADEILLITTPDPHAILDAYALVKTVSKMRESLKIKLALNRVEKSGDEARIKLNLLNASKTYLSQPLEYLGAVPESRAVARSIREMHPFILTYPESNATAGLSQVAARLIGSKKETPTEKQDHKGLKRFIGELQKLFSSSG